MNDISSSNDNCLKTSELNDYFSHYTLLSTVAVFMFFLYVGFYFILFSLLYSFNDIDFHTSDHFSVYLLALKYFLSD